LNLAKINALSQRTDTQSVWFCESFCKNHLPTTSPTLPLSALLTICPVQLPFSLARTETNFKVHSALILKSDNVAVPKPYSSVSFPPHSPSFSRLTMFILSFTVKTTSFISVAITQKFLKKFPYIKPVRLHTRLYKHAQLTT